MRWLFLFFQSRIMKHFVQKKKLSWGWWVTDDLALNKQSWQATPENKVIWETLKEDHHQIWAACWGKLHLKSPLWAWLTMPVDIQLRWTVLTALFPDFTWKWGADALTASPSHKVEFGPSPVCWPDHEHLYQPQLVHTTLTLARSWFQVGKGREIFKKYFKSTGRRLHQLFCLQNYFFLFLLFTGFQGLMKDLCEQIIQCKVDDALQCFLKSNTFISWYSRKLPIIILIPLGLNSRRIN